LTAIRVLVVDDSVVIRKLLTTTLNEDKEVEVVATASHGRIALAKIPQVNPDIVILDVEMPEMDGLETLLHLRKDWPRLPVIMFSTKTDRGAAATIEALSRGASDYVAKPSNVGSLVLAMARVREEMLPKIKALCPRGQRITPVVRLAPTPAAPAKGATIARTPVQALPIALVAIGASTGGPNALNIVLPRLAANFPVPIVIVQHMLATFTQHFAARLATQCQLQVVEAKEGDLLRPGCVYIARGDYHLLVARRGREGFAVLNQATPENFCRPAVDVLFDSAARAYGASVLGVVLTGMGQDGLRGSKAIRQAGGDVIVQDEETSVVWGMPGFVAAAGLATQVLPIDRVATEIERLVERRTAPLLSAVKSK
jgi:two-component system, chemotaxis family, protein-glutamate methylesterase/glutaminase